jgi:hypothetical protein
MTAAQRFVGNVKQFCVSLLRGAYSSVTLLFES